MGSKRKAAEMSSNTAGKLQSRRKRKVGMKNKSGKFVLDQKGGSRPAKSSHLNKIRAGYTLGHDPLIQKERELVADLFGDDGDPLEKTEKNLSDQKGEQHKGKLKSKVKKKVPSSIPDDPFDIHQQDEQKQKRPAWVDEDDHTIRVKDAVAGMDKARGTRGIREISEEQYSHTLQQKFNQIVGGTPEWACLHSPDKDVEEGGLVKSTADYLAHGRSVKLDKKRLDSKREADLNHSSRTEGAIISAVEFNRNHQVALVAGFSRAIVGAVSLFKVDGILNHLIHSVKFPKFPVKYAKFICDGGKFLAGSNQYNHFYMYDLEAAQETKIPSNLGKDGHNMKDFIVSPDGKLLVFIARNGELHLFDADSLSLVETLHTPGDVTAAAFSTNGSRLYTHTTEGDVCIWDMNARECVHRFYDDGCFGGTSIAVSPDNQYLACGSSTGVVNVYDLAHAMGQAPVPVKILSHLCTSVSTLTFNSSSEILATASNQVENAIRLAHLPSMTYFENFPHSGSNLRRIQVMNFSPQSGFLAVGNNTGRAFLYRLHHFTNF